MEGLLTASNDRFIALLYICIYIILADGESTNYVGQFLVVAIDIGIVQTCFGDEMCGHWQYRKYSNIGEF